WKINIKKRNIILSNHTPLRLLRPDKTVKDIDLIFFRDDRAKVENLKTFVTEMKRDIRIRTGLTPPISFEGAFYFDKSPKQFLQYVTVIGVQKKLNEPYLMFDRVQQKISWESLEAWTVTLENGITYTTRNPIADYFAYQFRVPSGIKPKDVEKLIYLNKIVDDIKEAGKKVDIDYFSSDYYGSWQDYIDQLGKSTLPSVKMKRFITYIYWKTIGTPLAHGKGFIGKGILALFNFFVKLRQ
ncbi:MAG: hypothetical protein AAB966_01310, partial [Patescibacteria group bacterium]